MNLMTYAARYFGLVSLLAMGVAGCLTYWFVEKTFDEEATELLRHERTKLEGYVRVHGTLPHTVFSLTDSIFSSPAFRPAGETLKDTVLFNDIEREPLAYRRLSFDLRTRDGWQRVTLQRALYETEDLAEGIVAGMLGLLGTLLVTLTLTNYLLSRRVWRPFHQTLAALQTFRLSQNAPIPFPSTRIAEFRALQTQLLQLTGQLQREYQSLRAFTENASHELQTPLAILRSKLELLLETENLGETASRQTEELMGVVGRLARLNQSLLLLTKIENRQYVGAEDVDLTALVQSKLALLSDWIDHRSLRVDAALGVSVRVPMNPHLGDVLVTNLLTNAIRHNEVGGEVRLALTDEGFQIANTGPAPAGPVETYWARFQKARPDSESPGLGLALVREIAQTYGFTTAYEFADGWHRITVGF